MDGFSNPIIIDEEKPGIRGFDCVWAKDGTVITYQVMRVRRSSPAKSQQPSATKKNPANRNTPRPNLDIEVLGSEMDDLEFDDGSSVANTMQ